MTGLNISATGFLTAARRLEVNANNIANLATPGFQASRADSVELKGGGTAIGSITTDPTPPLPGVQGEFGFPGGSNVNLAVEITNTIVNRNAFQANINAFRAQADLIGELLDLTR